MKKLFFLIIFTQIFLINMNLLSAGSLKVTAGDKRLVKSLSIKKHILQVDAFGVWRSLLIRLME